MVPIMIQFLYISTRLASTTVSPRPRDLRLIPSAELNGKAVGESDVKSDMRRELLREVIAEASGS